MQNHQPPHHFHNDHTIAQPFYPPPPPYQPQLPEQKPLPHERFWTLWHRYRSMRKKAQWGLGCLVVFLLCGTCSCMGALAAPSSPPVATSPSPTATQVTLSNTSQATPTIAVTGNTGTSTPSPSPSPTPVPVSTPTPKPTCQAVNTNPWCYNFSPGSLIYRPPSAFCRYFACIATFYEPDDPGDGYIVQCVDGLYSQSGGERGACSRHGGVGRTLYAH